jgi:RNA polymerase sigma factor (TIGR02999 family)
MPDRDLTRLISAASRGEPGAQDRLWDAVYTEVKQQVRRTAAKRGSPVQPTELVNQVYLKIASARDFPCADRRYFFGMVARAIQQILADHAKSRRRRGDIVRVGLVDAAQPTATEASADPQILVDALADLEAEDPRCAEIVRLRALVGLEVKKVAELLEMTVRTVEREWHYGRHWLARYMSSKDGQ